MSKIIIGIDPDSKKHGVSIYENGKLIALESLSLMGLQGFLFSHRKNNPVPSGETPEDIEVHIEDVCANNAIFMKPGRMDKKREAELKARARTLGMVQHSQIEIERMLIRFHIVPVKHKISKMWKKDKAQFEKVTGWKGRSNEDTRSAAYFGWLGVSKSA